MLFVRCRNTQAQTVLVASAAALMLALSASHAGAAVRDPDVVYGSPTLESVNGEVIITADGNPGGSGVAWRYELDPTHTYRVFATGTSIQGPFTMRLRANSEDPLWETAPNGTAVRRFSGASSLEVLFYGGHAGDAYRLEDLRLDDCTRTCKEDPDLAAEILRAQPDLPHALAAGDDRRAAELILDWAAPRIPFAHTGISPITTRTMSASEMYYDNFSRGTAGVFCDGASDFLVQLLELFGLDAFRLDIGDPTTALDHSTVILRRSGGKGSVSYYAVDPSFGLTFGIRGSERQVPISEVLRAWGSGGLDRLAGKTIDLRNRPLVSRDPQTRVYSTARCGDAPNLSTACSLQQYLSGYRRYLVAAGYEPGLSGFVDNLLTSRLQTPRDVPADFAQWRDAALSRLSPVALPENNLMANATVLPAGGDATITGANLTATAEIDEPRHGVSPGGASVWFVWAPARSERVAFDTCDTDFDTVLAAYAGGVNPPTRVASNDDGCARGGGSRISFAAENGALYWIAVDGYEAATGEFRLRSESPPETHLLSHPPRRTRRSRVAFTFGADEAKVSFRCRVGRATATTCTSPFVIRRRIGNHRFRVKAVDAEGSADPDPASWRWVVRRHR